MNFFPVFCSSPWASPLLFPYHPPPLLSLPDLSLSFPSHPCPLLPPQWFSPLSCHQLLGAGLLRMGRLSLRSPSHAGPAPGLWLSGFGLLRGDHLFLCPAPGPGPPAPEDMVHLRRLQEISEQGCGQGSRVVMGNSETEPFLFGNPYGKEQNVIAQI